MTKMWGMVKAAFGGVAVQNQAPADPILAVVNPQARDRWISSRARSYTPEQVEMTLRGAMSGQLEDQWRLFDLMQETWPRLSKNLNELMRSVVGLEWNLHVYQEQDGVNSAEQERKKEVVEYALFDMTPDAALDQSDWDGTIRDLLDAWPKGISVCEVLWEQRQSRLGQIIAPRATAHVMPRFYGYPNSESWLGLKVSESGVRYDGPGPVVDGHVRFPMDRFLVGICKAKAGHPLSGALLRPLAWWWCAANFTQSWFLNFAQIFGVPIRWAQYDANKPGLLDKVSDMLESMGSAGWGAFPTGTTLELKESAKAGADNPQVALMDRADKQCDLLILGQTLTTDVGKSGSLALGNVHSDVRSDVIEAAGKWVATVINTQLIPSICRLNFGTAEDCPWVAPCLKKAKDSKGMAERDALLLAQGVDLPMQWFYERHDIPMPQPDEPVISGRSLAAPAMDPNSPPNNPDPMQAKLFVQAKSAQDKLTDTVMERLSGVEARWLGSLRPYFRGLIVAARSGDVTDAQFIQVLEQAQRQFPEFFDQMDKHALQTELEAAMGASCINGALKGAAQRRIRK